MQRANYQTLIWRKAVINYPDLPKPETSGWTENAQGDLEIQWYKDNFIPDELQDVLADRNHTDEDEQRECLILMNMTVQMMTLKKMTVMKS